MAKYRGRRNTRVTYRARARTYAKPMQKNKAIARGSKFRARIKAKGTKYQKFVFYGVIQAAQNITVDNGDKLLEGTANPARPAVTAGQAVMPKLESSVSIWFGPSSTAANIALENAAALAPGYIAPVGPVGNARNDAAGNTNNLGDGLLLEVNRRDLAMSQNRWDYGGFEFNAASIISAWNRVQNAGQGVFNVPITGVYVKGIKVSVAPRAQNTAGLVYFMTRADRQQPVKLRESIGKGRAYYKTKKNTQGQLVVGNLIHWQLPDIWIGSYVGSRVKCTVYYKIKGSALPN